MNPVYHIRISDFDYSLPPEKIAQFPLEQRDASKLLVWKEGKITDTVFSDVDTYLPEKSLLVFNETKVIRARLIFSKSTGATIEIFCLEPVWPTAEIHEAFQRQESASWICLVGNVKRWKSGILKKEIDDGGRKYVLTAEKQNDAGDGRFLIHFRWEPATLTFSEILESSGRIPLPPYINRGDNENDALRYQTVYAKEEGSVAAPTAGLHFTEEVMERLRRRNFSFENLALHIGVGTFRPVTSETLADHVMHHERVVVTTETIRNLIRHFPDPVVVVGTTSVRTLESLYWFGVKLSAEGDDASPVVGQWDPYDEKYPGDISPEQALSAVEQYLTRKKMGVYQSNTQLMIVPGYRFRLVDALITNFHMPGSTLLLLVAALIGDDWKKVYSHALGQDYRFLSYGDSCLFFRKDRINSLK
jgi:S-adenosylmethionine:tRNA ribosyltransferase-isomerase